MQPDESTPNMDDALATVRQSDALRAASPPEPLRTLAEWLADPAALEPPKQLVPYLVLDGRVTLLAAREKAGKSTLLGQAVATLSRGGDFLGQPCGPGRVVWYAIDEPAPDAVRRLSECGAEGAAVVIQSQKPTPEHVRHHIHEFTPSLVVVDTLTELLTGRLQNDRDAMEWARALGPYMDVFRDTKTAAVLVHHATKDGREYRGSGQLGAKVDVIAMLRIPSTVNEQDDDPDVDPESETRRILDVKGRGIQGKDRLFFDGSEYQLGEGDMGLSARIVKAVGDGCDSVNKVVTAVRGRRETVALTVNQLIESGKVMRDGKALRLPLYGSRPMHDTRTGTSRGTTHASNTHHVRTSPEPLGNHRDLTAGTTGTSGGTDDSEAVPAVGAYSPQAGTTSASGPGVEPLDWASMKDAA
jgi:hypothetical protein